MLSRALPLRASGQAEVPKATGHPKKERVTSRKLQGHSVSKRVLIVENGDDPVVLLSGSGYALSRSVAKLKGGLPRGGPAIKSSTVHRANLVTERVS
jgi:hypothetical protein